MKYWPLIALLFGASLQAADVTSEDIVGDWQVVGLSEAEDEAPEAGPPEVFEFHADGTVRSQLADVTNEWRVEGDRLVIEAPQGRQEFEVLDYDGTHMRWKFEIGDMLVFYHLKRAPD